MIIDPPLVPPQDMTDGTVRDSDSFVLGKVNGEAFGSEPCFVLCCNNLVLYLGRGPVWLMLWRLRSIG